MEKTTNNLNKFIIKIKYIFSWMKLKTELNEMYFNQKFEDIGKPYVMKGDIYYAYLGTNIGAEIDKGRPVLVFQNDDRYIRQSNMVSILPITSNTKINPYKIQIKSKDVLDNDGIKNSAVLIQQIRSISKNRLLKYKGKLNDSKLKEVSDELHRFLYKQNPHLSVGDAQTVNVDAAKSVIKV